MPKQIFKINNFEGGVNNNSDARDLSNNEIADGLDVNLENIGKVGVARGTIDHFSKDAAASTTISNGYGLFSFRHDRLGASVGDLEHLAENTAASDTKWDQTGGGSFSSNLTHTHASAASTTFDQAAADRAVKGVNGCNYRFIYTIASPTGSDSDISVFRILGGASQFATANVDLTQTDGTHEATFTARDDATSNSFSILITTTGAAVITIDDMSLKVYNAQETGDDYIALSNADNNVVSIYSKNNNTWNDTITGMTNNDGGSRKDIFNLYNGNLRIADSNLSNTNSTQWYGYIKTNSGTYTNLMVGDIDGWKQTDAAITTFSYGICGNFGSDTGHTNSGAVSGESHATDSSTTQLHPYNSQTPWTAEIQAQISSAASAGTHFKLFSIGLNEIQNITSANGSSDYLTVIGFSAELDSDSNNNYVVMPPPAIGINVSVTGTELTGSGWDATTYKLAASLIYDGNQESKLFILAGTFELAANEYPKIYLYLNSSANDRDSNPIYDAYSNSLKFDPRTTGLRLYFKKHDSTDEVLLSGNWKLMLDVNWEEGMRIYPTDPYTMHHTLNYWGGHAGQGYRVLVANATDNYDSPYTYNIMSGGVSPDSTSINARYKAITTANGRAYLGNLKYTNESGANIVAGDAMLKTPTNAFDIHLKENLSEVSVNDGDEIICLHSFADRILQYKKHDVYVINISQELEFIENVFYNRGVNIPTAVVKTSSGIAWVNTSGVYFYNGEQMLDLFLNNGKKVISRQDWKDFLVADGADSGTGETTLNPEIYYLPKNKELLVYSDSGAAGSNAENRYAMIYSMSNKSWSYLSKDDTDRDFIAGKTNSVLDSNNDLAFCQGTTKDIKVWSDKAVVSSKFKLITKDYDFESPGVRKKIYKVYITYKTADSGSVASNVQVKYDVNGGTALNKTFQDGDNFSSNTLAVANGWQVAELKPTTSSDANNVKSFQLHLFASGGDAPVGFEVNDISIVYRVKGIK